MADAGTALPLREYDETVIESRLRLLAELVVPAWPNNPAVAIFVSRLRGPDFPFFVAGFIEGAWLGGRDRLRDWRKDTEDTLTRLRKLLVDEAGRVKIGRTIEVGIATSLWEFFERPLSGEQIELGKISPAAEEAMGELQLLHDLAPFFVALQVFEEKTRATSFIAALGDLAHSIVQALLVEGTNELWRILIEPDAEKQGSRIGSFLGAGIVEVVRALAEPPSLTVVELVSLLALDADEQTQLGIGGRP